MEKLVHSWHIYGNVSTFMGYLWKSWYIHALFMEKLVHSWNIYGKVSTFHSNDVQMGNHHKILSETIVRTLEVQVPLRVSLQ
jgi:hypothetical protein